MILQPVNGGGGSSPTTAKAECLPADEVGDAVYIRGPRTGSRYLVAKCDPSDPSKMPSWGIIIQKEIGGSECVVQISGLMQGYYTGLTPGRRYFVGLDGKPRLPEDFTGPSPSQRHRIQSLGISLDTEVLLLRPSTDLVTRVGL